MSENKHTPGPWLATHDEFDEALQITCASRLEGGYVEIARVSVGYSDAFETEQHANARLIAAAPDLLEALKLCASALLTLTGEEAIKQTTVLNAWAQCVEAEAVARSALSKAQGTQS